jgi:hypothetical protein
VSTGRQACATGGCQCGAVRYALYVPPQKSHVCHCRMCQRATGGLFAALAGAPRADFAFTQGTPAFFASSNVARRGFCATCGTPLTFAYDDPAARIYVTIGSLDEPAAAPIIRQYGIESRLPWVQFCEQVPAEATGADPADADLLARIQSRQAP